MSENYHFNNTFLDLREEDNLSIVDEMADPNVSFIQRFHRSPLQEVILRDTKTCLIIQRLFLSCPLSIY